MNAPQGGQNGAFGGDLERFDGVEESGGRPEPSRSVRQRENFSSSLLAQGRSVLRRANPEAMKTSPCRTGRKSPMTPKTSSAHPAERRTRRKMGFGVLVFPLGIPVGGNPAVILDEEDRNRGSLRFRGFLEKSDERLLLERHGCTPLMNP